MPTVLAIRHAHSTANEQVPISLTAEDLAFANRSAGLSEERGPDECSALAQTLPEAYGIYPADVPAAISEFKRTELTAALVGFTEFEPYPVLNEVEHNMDLDSLRKMLRQNQIPRIAQVAAMKTLEQPPPKRVWITHGLLIAGLCTVLGIADQYERPVPRQCEARWLTF